MVDGRPARTASAVVNFVCVDDDDFDNHDADISPAGDAFDFFGFAAPRETWDLFFAPSSDRLRLRLDEAACRWPPDVLIGAL